MNIQPCVEHDSVGNDDGSHGGEDFVLTGRSAWITIEDYSLFISNKEDGIRVMLLPVNDEMSEPLEQFEFIND